MRNQVVSYALALVAVAVAVVVRILLDPLLGDRVQFVTLYAAVIFAAWYGGRGPAWLAVVAGAAAVAYFVLPPRHSLAVQQVEYQVGLVIYCLVGFGSVVAFEAVRRAKEQAEEKQRLLEEEVLARRAAEKDLADREELLRITFASIGDAVITTDTNGTITYLNAVAQAVTGWTEKEAQGNPLSEVFRIINEESRKPVENPVEKALRDGRVVGLANHTLLIARDGTERSIDDSAAPIHDDDGRIMGVVLVFRDISVRRHAEEMQQRLAAIVQSSDDAIMSKDLDGNLTSWNAAATRLYGYTAEEMIGKPVSMLMPADRLDDFPAIMDRVQRGERTDHFETVRRRKDGSLVDVSITVSPMCNSTGMVIGASVIARDISARKRTEEALKEAGRRKDEFLAMLAHELRNPLAPVRNSLELMKHARGRPELLEEIRSMMERQLKHMVRLVDDLLDVNRITRGKLELKKETVELASIVHHAVETSHPHCQCAGHQLTVTVPPEPVYLDADPVRLAQVVSNLLTNACKYTEPGGQIWLAAERQDGEVTVKVKDTGVGIPAEMMPRIFDMFAQVDQSLARSQGGLGIGLSLVKQLVEMHGGSVTAHSDGPGRGSEFVVHLPVLTDGKIELPTKPTSEPGSRMTRRILIVDDNWENAESFALLLSMTGNETATAHDGAEAVEKAAAFRPDVILLDIGLPKMSGHDVCRCIRDQPWGRDIAIVAVTGWGQDEDRRKSKEAGFDHHLVKPVEYSAVVQLLKDLESANAQAGTMGTEA